MNEYLNLTGASIVAALYLRCGDRTASMGRRLWPRIVDVLRRDQPSLGSCAAVLRAKAMNEAATILESPGRLAAAESWVREGRCLTVTSDGYPHRWIETLGPSAPPAVWISGPIPQNSSFVSIVGCREVATRVERFAHQAGRTVAHSNLVLVSGGARGCDSAAERGALRAGGYAVRILAQGLASSRSARNVLQLSACAPDEPFSTANAMERNALIYAASERTLVVQSRFREGGTWHGTTHALRRNLTHIFYRDSPELWAKAFKALGGQAIFTPEQFLEADLRDDRLLA